MPTEVPMTTTVDPDVLKASEAFSETGARQMRVVIVNDLAYVDGRDVDWLLARASEVFAQWRLQHFWSQIAIATLLDREEDWRLNVAERDLCDRDS